MPSWEYCYLHVDALKTQDPVVIIYCHAPDQPNLRPSFTAALAELGDAGWELVSITSSDVILSAPDTTPQQRPAYPFFFFKRLAEEKG
jgi:hypothetical protein